MNEYFKNLNRIEFVVTMACTGRCKHCSQGEPRAFRDHIKGDCVSKAIRDICSNYQIQSLMTFGGEPLLYPEEVCKIHAAATEAGIPQREMITNGFFSKSKERIKEVAHMLAESGLNYIMLSVDAFHEETIPLEFVRFFADCAKDEGILIKLHPAWLVSNEDDNLYNKRTREILLNFTEKGFAVSSGNVIWPEGNAKKYLSEYFDENIEYVNPYSDDPRDVWSLCFKPNGDVLNGNIYKNCILDIIKSYSGEV
ncbi:radical SAM protein [Anaerocolumna sp. AGMB13020]|uniref:radical SAM protein n=1 Tax=Anaerocolumna sp. AGMB13020 TaxID=3081750 RepID=UPI002955BAB1|nr:radical SAM protein [Anaerocolumna sp. AGMB13020]WOO37563.1 radical SAM protein [Anaerocolumna sp. AGMB13020]